MVAPAPPPAPPTLFALPSKEWVIPAKPKPGRKPKKDLAPPPKKEDEEELDSKGRRVQNRAAQRAFRERKQSQLADLQARVQLYEQGEIERNVALQNIAKRLKEENELLRRENAILRDELTRLGASPNPALNINNKRSLGRDSPNAFNKRARIDQQHALGAVFLPSPSSIASSPESFADPYSPISFQGSPQDAFFPPTPHSLPQQPAMASLFSASPSLRPPGCMEDFMDCGFCSDDTPCVCRELAMQQQQQQQQHNRTSPVPAHETIKVESAAQPSILDNLPAYAPPVPLPRRTQRTSGPSSIFPVYPHSTNTITLQEPRPPQRAAVSAAASASCSGDPSNCLACADDPFGRAFCESVTASSPPRPSQTESDTDTIPCNEAWAQLKTHPNIAFADLQLLAEVVARRSDTPGRDGSVADPGSPRRRVTEVQTDGVRDALLILDGHQLAARRS